MNEIAEVSGVWKDVHKMMESQVLLCSYIESNHSYANIYSF